MVGAHPTRQANHHESSVWCRDAVVETLPKHPAPPASFEAFTELGVFDLAGSTTDERAASVPFTYQVIHVPGATLDCIRKNVLSSSSAKASQVTTLSTHDIMSAAIWVLREIAAGNDLSGGLKQCWVYLVNLRKQGIPQGSIPKDFWGNCQRASTLMPPERAAPANDSAPSPASTPATSNGSASPETATAMAAGLSGRIQATLHLAACHVHAATKAMRDDPMTVSQSQTEMLGLADIGLWKIMKTMPGFSSFRDCAGGMTSWRNLDNEHADFGQGRACVFGGQLMPLQWKVTVMTTGPNNDGVVCFTGFLSNTLERLEASNILQEVLPGACIIRPDA